MNKKNTLTLLLLFVAASLWNAGANHCFSNDVSFIFSGGSASGGSVLSSSTKENISLPKKRELVAFSSESLFAVCINDGNNGARSFQPTPGRTFIAVRLMGNGENILRVGDLPSDDIRSLYGLVRPHLFLCRLLI